MSELQQSVFTLSLERFPFRAHSNEIYFQRINLRSNKEHLGIIF